MPIPPIQWVRLLQKRIDLGRLSISVKIEEPVVVKPETDSNHASVKDAKSPDRINGNEPIALMRNHEDATDT